MLNWGKFPTELRGKLWAEAANCATKLENIMIKENSEKCTYEKMWNKRPKYLRYLRRFGEIAVVKTGAKIKSKLTDRG